MKGKATVDRPQSGLLTVGAKPWICLWQNRPSLQCDCHHFERLGMPHII
ncbi:MAG: hypothetical protein NZ899_01345 [Thermoguttaceae bacterium]|nr:hypothetical protein [Thermoguttaceae bacterium]MDW8077537.1 hypothetical protein [Thermoguttaceae bacterium]